MESGTLCTWRSREHFHSIYIQGKIVLNDSHVPLVRKSVFVSATRMEPNLVELTSKVTCREAISFLRRQNAFFNTRKPDIDCASVQRRRAAHTYSTYYKRWEFNAIHTEHLAISTAYKIAYLLHMNYDNGFGAEDHEPSRHIVGGKVLALMANSCLVYHRKDMRYLIEDENIQWK